SMPDVPTLEESGIPLSAYAWLGVCAGAGIPQPTIAMLNHHIVQIVNSPEYRTLVESSGSVAASSTAQEFREIIEETANDAGPIFREFGVQLDWAGRTGCDLGGAAFCSSQAAWPPSPPSPSPRPKAIPRARCASSSGIPRAAPSISWRDSSAAGYRSGWASR